MGKLEQTKGTFRLSGKTNIEKMTTKDFGWMQKTNMTVKTLKDNFVQTVFESKNGKGLDVSVKGVNDEKSTKFPYSEVVDVLKSTFTNDEFVFVVGVTEYDSYNKKVVLKPTGVFHSNSDYDNEDFEESNFVEHEFIFSQYKDGKATLVYVSYFGEVSELEFSVSEDFTEDFSNFKYGDLLKVVYSVINKPKYIEVSEGSKSGYVPKGKGVSGNNKRTIDGYIEDVIIVGISDVTKNVYTRQVIRDAQAAYEEAQLEYKKKTENSNNQSGGNSESTKEEDDTLPY